MCLKGCLLSGLEGGLCTHVVGELQRRAIELKWEEWYSGTVNPRTTQVVAGVEGKPRVFFLTPEPHQPPRWTQSAMVMAMHGEKVTPCGCAQCMTHCACAHWRWKPLSSWESPWRVTVWRRCFRDCSLNPQRCKEKVHSWRPLSIWARSYGVRI